jgi:HPt (histidine-containing phosphotransfer) domain-containing protein
MDTQRLYENLCQALKSQECSSIASHAHALKGVGRNLGIEPFVDVADRIERAGNKDDVETCLQLFADLSHHVENTLNGISDLLGPECPDKKRTDDLTSLFR